MILPFLVCIGVSIGFLVMGIKIRKSDKPAGYYTLIKKPEVDSVKKYNNAISVLWYIASVFIIGNAVPLLFLEKDSPELVKVWIACLIWLVVLVSAYWIIDYVRSVNKTKTKNTKKTKSTLIYVWKFCND